MTTFADLLGLAAIATGLAFFVAGSIGLLRFPDAPTRLHALTKADTLGLGLVALGGGLLMDDVAGRGEARPDLDLRRARQRHRRPPDRAPRPRVGGGPVVTAWPVFDLA